MELQVIQGKIFEIRGCKVILDFDLAELYCTETRLSKRAVRRNLDRFPVDFMFQLTTKMPTYYYLVGYPKLAHPNIILVLTHQLLLQNRE